MKISSKLQISHPFPEDHCMLTIQAFTKLQGNGADSNHSFKGAFFMSVTYGDYI